MNVEPKRVKLVPCLHGKRTPDGRIGEPDIYHILDRWLARHLEVKSRERDVSISRGRYTTLDGLETEMVRVTIVAGDDVAGYDPAADRDLYSYFLAEERG
jgi:hypothetical protein